MHCIVQLLIVPPEGYVCSFVYVCVVYFKICNGCKLFCCAQYDGKCMICRCAALVLLNFIGTVSI